MIAWRDVYRDPYRLRAFEYVRAYYDELELPVVIAGGSGERFTKTSALNEAIRLLLPETIIVQSDPDSFLRWTDATQDAVDEASAAPGLVIPHERYLYLGETATRNLFRGDWLREPVDLDCDSHGHAGVGNVTVFSRETWERAGGYDERFGIWGGDDAAFAYACGALVAPQRRLPGDVIHLYHPRHPDSMIGSPGYAAQAAILDQYRDAEAIGTDALRELVANR